MAHANPSLCVWVAVGDNGDGFVLGWAGAKADGDAEHGRLSTHDWFGEELFQCGRLTSDHDELDHPTEPGLYFFTGRMQPSASEPDDGVVDYVGSWRQLETYRHMLPRAHREAPGSGVLQQEPR